MEEVYFSKRCHRPEVENFVILDDDTFWNWQWLGTHFVCTTRKNADGTYKKGLDRKCAYEAIQVLKSDGKHGTVTEAE